MDRSVQWIAMRVSGIMFHTWGWSRWMCRSSHLRMGRAHVVVTLCNVCKVSCRFPSPFKC